MIVYIAGPMTGLPDFNFPAFHKAAKELRDQGYVVVNPAENFEGRQDLPREIYLLKAIRQVLECDRLHLLDGYENSRGALLELSVAQATGKQISWPLGTPELVESVVPINPFCPNFIHEPSTFTMKPQTILDEAKSLVYGDRNTAYGHPADDYERTARIWSAILGADVTAKQCALCMAGVKISRECHQPKRDNLVDLAGYAACAHRIEERKAGRE